MLAFHKEKCILVDENDNSLGPIAKVDAHRVIDGTVPLHRALTVLVFNKNGDLLLQERSRNKITYPNVFSNSCCSHPLFDVDGPAADPEVVRVAAQRRLHFELGIPLEEIPLHELKYVTRLYFRHWSHETWGEHEISYHYVLRKDVTLNPNPDEVESIRFISRTNYRNEMASLPRPLSPWFELFFEKCYQQWWRDLEKIETHYNPKSIQRFY